MISKAYVWAWLPGATEPVPTGRVELKADGVISFNYGRSYLDRSGAISLFEPELPLVRGRIDPKDDLRVPGCLRDCAPDAWGRRVILNRLTGDKGDAIHVEEIDELTYWLESGSNRIGALDFQASATEYVPRLGDSASLDELLQASRLIEEGVALSPGLAAAMMHGTSLGGARPKAAIEDDEHQFIAKFSSSKDTINVVKAEFVAMRLASMAGLDVARVRLESVAGKDVLLVERFDRKRADDGWLRLAMVSGLTVLQLDEMMARYASYRDLSMQLQTSGTSPVRDQQELFRRLVFNILCGNTDDHARNHAAFWDGEHLSLTPAYDLCPQPRIGQEAGQAMSIDGTNRASQLAACVASAHYFQLSQQKAFNLIWEQVDSIRANWAQVVEEAGLSEVDERTLSDRAFLNPYAFEGFSARPTIGPKMR